MARSSICMTSILLLSLAILASATHDYSYDNKKPEENKRPDLVTSKPYYKVQNTKPEENESKLPHHDQSSKPEEGKHTLIDQHATLEFPNPKTEKKENNVPKKPNHESYEKPKPSEPSYGKLPKVPKEKDDNKLIPSEVDYKKQKSEEEKKLPIAYPEKENSVPTKPVYGETTYSEKKEKVVPVKPNYEQKKYQVPSTITIQGDIYCKTGLKLFPLPGAVAKVTCLAVDEESYQTSEFSVLSKPCDSKGKFYATISSPKYQSKIKDCKAYLNYSPLDTCKVPTDINDGISGDLVAANYDNLRNQKDVKDISVGPFFYTTPVQTYNTYANNGY